MPRVARRSRKLKKLTEREIEVNKKEVVVTERKLGALSVKLIECTHRQRQEMDIPSIFFTCFECIWEEYDTEEL